MECMITDKIVKNIIERRSAEIHKGDCGRILIGAGSPGMAGAAILCGRGAMRAGAGLVQMLVPKELFPILQVGLVEATCLERDLSKIDLRRFDAAALGPGLGGEKDSIHLVRTMVNTFEGPMVVDADGLNIIGANNLFEQLKNREKNGFETVITPHMGEAMRLLGEEAFEKALAGGRKEVAFRLAEKTGAITALKGAGTVVATADGKAYTNTTGNPGMATGGAGDVLTGIIAAFLGLCKCKCKCKSKGKGNRCAQAMEPKEERPLTFLDAALAGVYIHGLAGDLGANAMGQYGLMAGDIAYYTALAIKKVLDES